MKKWFGLLLVIMFCAMAVPQTVQAFEMAKTATVTIKATVPEGFGDNISVQFIDLPYEFLVNPCTLTAENGYSFTYNKAYNQGDSYKVVIDFDGIENYKNDLAESYEINKEAYEISFSIEALSNTDRNAAAQEEVNKDIEKENFKYSFPHREDNIDPLTNIATPKSVMNWFMESLSFLDGEINNVELLNYLKSNSAREETYLKYNPSGTSEEWNNMSLFQQYAFRQLVSDPARELNKNNFESEDAFVDELLESYEKERLLGFENGEKICDALELVFRWHYKYYIRTGVPANPFVYETSEEQIELPEENNPVEETEIVTMPENSEAAEIDKVADEIKDSLTDDEKKEVEDAFKEELNNTQNIEQEYKSDEDVSLLVYIAGGVLIGAVIAGLAFVFVSHKK